MKTGVCNRQDRWQSGEPEYVRPDSWKRVEKETCEKGDYTELKLIKVMAIDLVEFEWSFLQVKGNMEELGPEVSTFILLYYSDKNGWCIFN